MPLTRILSVDDHEPFRRFTSSLLEKRPELQIIGRASDGLEAIQKAEELQPDLILLDIGLPKLNGMQAAKRIRIVAPHTKILFVSQESDSDVVGGALQLGAMGYVLKSNAGSELLPAIEAALGGERFVSRGLERHEFAAGKESQGPHRHAVLFCSDDAAILMASLVLLLLRCGRVMLRSCGPPTHTATAFVGAWRQGAWMLMPPFNAGFTFPRISPKRRTGLELSKPSEA